jgi:hypothetical protein
MDGPCHLYYFYIDIPAPHVFDVFEESPVTPGRAYDGYVEYLLVEIQGQIEKMFPGTAGGGFQGINNFDFFIHMLFWSFLYGSVLSVNSVETAQ